MDLLFKVVGVTPPPYGVPKCLQHHGESNDSEAEAPHTFFSKWLGRPPPPQECKHVCETIAKVRILGQRHLIPTFQSGWDDPPRECTHSYNTTGKARILRQRCLIPTFQSDWGYFPTPQEVPTCLQNHVEVTDSEAETPHTFFSKWLG